MNEQQLSADNEEAQLALNAEYGAFPNVDGLEPVDAHWLLQDPDNYEMFNQALAGLDVERESGSTWDEAYSSISEFLPASGGPENRAMLKILEQMY